MALLKEQGIPFILLTNGGGKHETERVAEISDKLQVPLDPSVIVQSHSPFAELVRGPDEQSSLENKCVLVVGGDGDRCRQVAEQYAHFPPGIPLLGPVSPDARTGMGSRM